jgi:formamidopyrimidine-DNA glycosylase
MTGARFDHVEIRRPDLRQPFPRRFTRRLMGQTVLSLSRRAKYLLATLSSGDTLLMHLGMSGSFRIAAPAARNVPSPTDDSVGSDRHDHVVFHMSSGATLAYNDPRRFGVMDLLSPGALAGNSALAGLGPEPLSREFDGATLAKACKGKKTSLKAALMDQRVVAGLGNIYVCEALHRAALSPRRRASTIAMPSGAPRESAHRLASAIQQVLTAAIERTFDAVSYRATRFRVYDCEGQPCRRARCGGVIRRWTQAGRATFYCPVCQAR